MIMSVPSEGKKALIQGRCATISWPEWRALVKTTGAAIGKFILEEILCRWGVLAEVVTDNGADILKGVEWLWELGIHHIRISPYNSRANGIVERKHFDVREALMKACGSQPQKWAQKAHSVFWAERVTVKRHLGMSPYKMAYGCDPVLPLDYEQATWLVPPMQPPMTTEELIAARSRQIEKRSEDIASIRERVRRFREKASERMLRSYKGLKAPKNIEPGTLVIVKNSRIEMEHNRKPKPRWLGPFIVLKRHSGGSYILTELDSSVIVDCIAAAHIRLHHARADVQYNVKQIIEGTPKYVWERANAKQAVDDEAEEEEADDEVEDEDE